MAAPMSASTLVRILRAEGLEVREYRNWRTRNRNHKGAWGPLNGVMVHHTVTSGTESSVRLCYEGHSTLPGPLCHGVIAKDGTVYLVGNGRANHAGSGDDDVLQAVIAERDLPRDNEANTDGNARYYGFEAINLGDGEDPWPDAQLEAIERASAAICRHYGWSAKSVIGHLEWQPGKVDPRGFGMDWMRRRVQDRLNQPPNQQNPQEDDGMQLDTNIDLFDWIGDKWPDLRDGIHVSTALGSGYAHSRRAAEASEASLVELKALRVTVDKLADAVGAAGNFDPADLKHAIRTAVADAVESVTVHLDVNEGN